MPNFKVGDKAVCVNMVWPECRCLNGVVVEVTKGLHKAHWEDENSLQWSYMIRIPAGVVPAERREGIIQPHKLRPLLKPKPRQQQQRRELEPA